MPKWTWPKHDKRSKKNGPLIPQTNAWAKRKSWYPIETSFDKVNTLLDQLNDLYKEQDHSDLAAFVEKPMYVSVDAIAKSNAAASEEITATVMELSKIADATRHEVNKFEVN